MALQQEPSMQVELQTQQLPEMQMKLIQDVRRQNLQLLTLEEQELLHATVQQQEAHIEVEMM